MSEQIEVILYYGPSEVGGIVKHRQQRLFALKGQLEMMDLNVVTKEWNHFNRLALYWGGNELFSCRLTFLQYPDVEDSLRDSILRIAIKNIPECMEAMRRQQPNRINSISSFEENLKFLSISNNFISRNLAANRINTNLPLKISTKLINSEAWSM